MNSTDTIAVFVCSNCGYEDSSFVPMGATLVNTSICDEDKIECPCCKKTVDKVIVQMPDSDFMTFQEYARLVRYINEKHSVLSFSGKRIKYISHTLDFRTGRIYKVTLDDIVFSKTNQDRHRNLDKWIRNYLDS